MYRLTTGEWFIFALGDGIWGAGRVGAPALGDVPVPADYDRDGKSDVAVYRRTTGEWFILGSAMGFAGALPFGSPVFGDVPVHRPIVFR